MDAKAWMEAFGEIGDRYLEEAIKYRTCSAASALSGERRHGGRRQGLRWLMASGGIVAAGILGVLVWRMDWPLPGGPNPGLPVVAEDREEEKVSGEAMSQGKEAERVPLSALPELVFSEAAQSETEADIGLPPGYFYHDMTESEIASIWGQDSASDEKNGLFWEGLPVTEEYLLNGEIIYDGEGKVWEAVIRGYKDEEEKENGTVRFTLTLAMDGLPPECEVFNVEKETCRIWDVPVEAFRQEGAQGATDYYCVRFVREEPETVGMKIGVNSLAEQKEETEELLRRLVSESLRPEKTLQLSQLTTREIPEWKSCRLTAEEAAEEEILGEWLPEALPEGWEFSSAWRELGQNRNYLIAEYILPAKNSSMEREYIDWTASVPENTVETVDIAKPESYDCGYYESRREIPDEYWDSMMNPVFRAEDVTPELLRTREEATEDTHHRPSLMFSIYYEKEGILLTVSAMATAEEIWEILPGRAASAP